MDGEAQRIVAVWAVLTVPFVVVTAYLWTQDDLTARFVAAYWFAPAVLTMLGVLPAPWQAVRA
ncbi:MAG: hypothetical protein ABEH90_01880 [Halolamina sp.]